MIFTVILILDFCIVKKNNKKTRTSSLEDFEKETIRGF